MPRIKKQRLEQGPKRGAGKRKALSREQLKQRNALVEQYYDFAELVVARLIRSMRLPVVNKDDFISAGLLGLIEAAGRFDVSRGREFQAYAYLRIRGAIVDHIRHSCDLTGYAYRRFKALEAAQELREAELEGRSVSKQQEEPCAQHAVSFLEKIAVAFKVSADHDDDEEEGEELDLLHPEAILEEKQTTQKIRAFVATLPEKERTIIEQYYFRDRKFVEVAEQLTGVSKSWVSRLHDRALEMLRDKIVEEAAEIAA